MSESNLFGHTKEKSRYRTLLANVITVGCSRHRWFAPDYNRACYVDVALTNENTSPTHLHFKVIRLTYNFTVFNITCYR